MYIIRSLWVPWMSIKSFSVNIYPCKHSILQGYSVLRNQQEALVKAGCPWIIHQLHYHSFSGLWSSSFWFLFAYSMQKWRGKAWFISSCEWCQCLTTGRQEKGECIMHIFILNKKLVFCFAKAQNSSLELILQEWLQACSFSWRTLLPLTIYLGKLWFRATWKQGKEFIAVTCSSNLKTH